MTTDETTNPGAEEATDSKPSGKGKSKAELEKELQQLKQANSLLVKKIADNSKRKSGDLPTVKVDGTSYQFTSPKFSLDGVKYEAEDAKNNKEVCAKLVEIGSALLKPVTEE